MHFEIKSNYVPRATTTSIPLNNIFIFFIQYKINFIDLISICLLLLYSMSEKNE